MLCHKSFILLNAWRQDGRDGLRQVTLQSWKADRQGHSMGSSVQALIASLQNGTGRQSDRSGKMGMDIAGAKPGKFAPFDEVHYFPV
jgi:hypothetical protein